MIRPTFGRLRWLCPLFKNQNLGVHQKVNESKIGVVRDTHYKLDDIYPLVVNEICKEEFFESVPYKKEWVKNVLEYNVLNGKQNRSKFLIKSYEFLKPDANNEEILPILILGYCIELLQSYFIVLDDIMDQSVTRRGHPCWYKVEGVGLTAINDGLFIYSIIPLLITRFLKNHKNYINVIELFNMINLKTIFGQSIDSESVTNSIEIFKMERYKNIVQFKTSYYTFILPVSTALYMANISNLNLHRESEKILLKMGEIFQIQDDYLDCYGDPKVIGKVGTDIENSKCSWLAAKAIELMSPEQLNIFQQCYGRPEPENVATIKRLYSDLGLQNEFQNLLKQAKSSIESDIEKITSPDLPKEMYYYILNKFISRKF